jgi:hypothetical protein
VALIAAAAKAVAAEVGNLSDGNGNGSDNGSGPDAEESTDGDESMDDRPALDMFSRPPFDLSRVVVSTINDA